MTRRLEPRSPALVRPCQPQTHKAAWSVRDGWGGMWAMEQRWQLSHAGGTLGGGPWGRGRWRWPQGPQGLRGPRGLWRPESPSPQRFLVLFFFLWFHLSDKVTLELI